MNVRSLMGWALVGFAGYLLFRTLRAAIVFVDRGAAPPIGDPVFVLPFAGGVLALIGGVLAGASRPGGVWFTLGGLFVFALLTGAMIAMGVFPEMWRDEAILTGCLGVFVLALSFAKRRRA